MDQPKGRWVQTHASDMAIGDLVREAEGEPERRLIHRTYPYLTSPTFIAEFEGCEPESIYKTHKIEIWDDAGAVAERITEISRRAIG